MLCITISVSSYRFNVSLQNKMFMTPHTLYTVDPRCHHPDTISHRSSLVSSGKAAANKYCCNTHTKHTIFIVRFSKLEGGPQKKSQTKSYSLLHFLKVAISQQALTCTWSLNRPLTEVCFSSYLPVPSAIDLSLTDADRSYLWVRSPISLLRWPRELSGVRFPSTGLSRQHLARLRHQHCFCLLPSIFIWSLHARECLTECLHC